MTARRENVVRESMIRQGPEPPEGRTNAASGGLCFVIAPQHVDPRNGLGSRLLLV